MEKPKNKPVKPEPPMLIRHYKTLNPKETDDRVDVAMVRRRPW